MERKNTYKTYSNQFKLDAINYKLRTGESFDDVAFTFGITEPSIIVRWMDTWKNEGIDGLSKVKGRPTMSKKKPIKREKKLAKE